LLDNGCHGRTLAVVAEVESTFARILISAMLLRDCMSIGQLTRDIYHDPGERRGEDRNKKVGRALVDRLASGVNSHIGEE
jgi:hypothetical protein